MVYLPWKILNYKKKNRNILTDHKRSTQNKVTRWAARRLLRTESPSWRDLLINITGSSL